MLDSLRSYGLQPARLLCPRDSPGKNTAVGCHILHPGDLPDPGIEPGSPELQADSLPPDPQGKPTRSTLVGGKDQLYSSAVTVGQDQRKALVQPW